MNSRQPYQNALASLRYVILPGHLAPASPYVDLHNRAFEYWKTFWNMVFEQNKTSTSTDFHSNFCSMSLVTLLLSENDVIGMMLHSIFNLEQLSHHEHPYFKKGLRSVFLDDLRTKNLSSVMSMEYLSIDPKWRKRELGVSLGAVITSLSTKIQQSCSVEASTGSVREDNGVADVFLNLGGVALRSNIDMHNTPVSLVCIYTNQVKELADPKARQLANTLWSNRLDISGQTSKNEDIKIAA